MTDQTNGYLIATTEITKSIGAAFAAGASIDEVFAALKVQAEIMNMRLAQAMMHQQHMEAMQQNLDLGEQHGTN